MITQHQADVRSYRDGEVLPGHNLYGIEVELEDVQREKGMDELVYWNISEDFSLRGSYAYEYTFKQPLAGYDVEQALKELPTAFSSANASSRTSVHVHIDIRSWTPHHLRSFILHWMAFERALVKYSGGREENIFCWPYYRSGYVDVPIHQMNVNMAVAAIGSKYTALNLQPSEAFGSMEIRTHKGTTDPQVILDWVCILNKMVEYTANEEHNLIALPEFYSGKGPLEFVREVFGEYADRLMYHSIAEDLISCIRDVQRVVHDNELNTFYTSGMYEPCSKEETLVSLWKNKRGI